jgi:hypothetical protein
MKKTITGERETTIQREMKQLVSEPQPEFSHLRLEARTQAKLLRRTLRRAQQKMRYHRWSLHDVPILFANSFPKSGTHLLTQVLKGFSRLGPAVDSGLPAITSFDGYTGRPHTEIEIQADLEQLLPGDIAYGHLHALPKAIEFLCQDGVGTFFILRDPRDVVVSHVHYVTDIEPSHIHHHYYKDKLNDFNERLETSILGLSDPAIPFPDIRARFEPYMAWLDRPEVLTLHFEDFVTNREGSIEQVYKHAVARGFQAAVEKEKAIGVLAQGVDPQRSPTFRSGKVGDWKTQFSHENKRLFKEIAGDLLIQLGYEQNHDW